MQFQFVVAACAVALTIAAPTDDDGKWHPTKHGIGRYLRPRDEGKYIHVPNPYKHIDNPYDGGFGPYSHEYDPYKGAETRDQYRLVLVPTEDLPYYKDGYYRNNGIKIISQTHNYEDDKYEFDFETENKIRAEEIAKTSEDGTASKGFYEYIGPDGFMYRVDYTADENGFRPKMRRIETPYSGKWVYEKVNHDTNQID